MAQKHSDYSELVKQAERAVASVTDPELKRAAFEKILEDLLAKREEGEPPKVSRARSQKVAPSVRPASTKKRGGPQAYIEELRADGFFKKPKTIAQVKAELGNRGHHIPLTGLSGPLQRLCQRRVLRRHKAKTSGNKQTYNYSSW